MNWTDKIQVFREDCKEVMKRYPDNHFDLAIVDPPYGIGIAKWDVVPSPDYFKELFRISKNQIVWGGNYFDLPITESWICWHKTSGFKMRALKSQSDFELAWTSFERKARLYPFTQSGNIKGLNGGRPDYKYKPIHPTQKPKELYELVLNDYAQKGDKIFDSHFGSGSIAIACHDLKFDLVGCEIDKEYYDLSYKRFKDHATQLQIF